LLRGEDLESARSFFHSHQAFIEVIQDVKNAYFNFDIRNEIVDQLEAE